MGKGRKPTPTALKLLQGNPGRRPINGEEPQFQEGTGEPPEWLNKEQRNFWAEVYPLLHGARVITSADEQALAHLCIALAEVRAATETLEAQGRYQVNDQGMIKVHPAVHVLNNALSASKSLMSEFGMTPASRTKIKALAGVEEENPLLKFLAGDG